MTLHLIHHVRRASGRAVFPVIRLIPRSYRFRAARMIAFCAGGPVDLVASVLRRPLRPASRQTHYLSYLLGGMDQRRLSFNPEVEISGLEELKAAARRGRGAVLLGVHENAGLARLILRLLDDARLPIVALSHAPEMPVPGAGRATETVRPSGAFLLTVRAKLRSGSVVCALVDSPHRVGDATQVVIAGASVWLSTTVLRVAHRWQVPIAFFRAELKGRSVAIELQACSPSLTTDEAIQALTVFLSAATPTRFSRSRQSPSPPRPSS